MSQEVRMIGERPRDLSPIFIREQDGSIASQLNATGFYEGVLAVEAVLKEQFANRPVLLDEIQDIFHPNLGDSQNG